MPGTLNHSPADIIREMLIDMGGGVRPSAATSTNWPVYSGAEPDSPDNCITVYDTTPIIHGRVMHNGETEEHEGIQIRIRAQTEEVGYPKAKAIATLLDAAYQEITHKGANTYTVWSITRINGPIPLGPEPATNRLLWTINAKTSIRLDS